MWQKRRGRHRAIRVEAQVWSLEKEGTDFIFQDTASEWTNIYKKDLSKCVLPCNEIQPTNSIGKKDNDCTVSVTITFAYTSGGNINIWIAASQIKCANLFLGDVRERVEEARRVTEDQKVVLDKIRHVHRFFKSLEVVCSAVEDVSGHSSYMFAG